VIVVAVLPYYKSTNKANKCHPNSPDNENAPFQSPSLFSLLLIMPPNGCFVLSGIQAASSVTAQEHPKHLVVVCLLWVPLYPNCFRMSVTLANAFICGVLALSSTVSNFCINDTTCLIKPLLRTPESAKSKSCYVGLRSRGIRRGG